MTDSINPFETNSKFLRVTYSSFIEEQVSGLAVGDSIKVDTGEKKVEIFRATLQYVAKELGVKLKTKSDFNGGIWVMRID